MLRLWPVVRSQFWQKYTRDDFYFNAYEHSRLGHGGWPVALGSILGAYFCNTHTHSTLAGHNHINIGLKRIILIASHARIGRARAAPCDFCGLFTGPEDLCVINICCIERRTRVHMIFYNDVWESKRSVCVSVISPKNTRHIKPRTSALGRNGKNRPAERVVELFCNICAHNAHTSAHLAVVAVAAAGLNYVWQMLKRVQMSGGTRSEFMDLEVYWIALFSLWSWRSSSKIFSRTPHAHAFIAICFPDFCVKQLLLCAIKSLNRTPIIWQVPGRIMNERPRAFTHYKQ